MIASDSISNIRTQVSDLAARVARGLPIISAPLEVQRARGNAGCTVHPRSRVQVLLKKAHTSIQVHRNHPASPHAMALRLITCSPWCTGFLATIARGSKNRGFDISVAIPGRHVFAVRIRPPSSQGQPSASITAHPTLLTLRNALPTGWDGCEYGRDSYFGKQEF